MPEDPFEDFETVFGLEDKFYDQGFKQGLADGARQSRVSARLFGIEKGFEKFIVMGELQAKARLWSSRYQLKAQEHPTSSSCQQPKQPADVEERSPETLPTSSTLRPSARLQKHIEVLVALVDPATIVLDNDDDAVAEFDDRLKRAQAKAKIIQRMIGNHAPFSNNGNASLIHEKTAKTQHESIMEDFGKR